MLREFKPVRYVYGAAAALLLGGTAYSMTTGNVGMQAQNAPRPVPVAGAPESFADLAERLSPAVVNISTTQRVPIRRQADPFAEMLRRFGQPVPDSGDGEQTRETGSLGSGFIISPDGYIVTNNHLIQGMGGNGTVDEVVVTLTDRTEYEARIVGRDERSDLALLKIDGANLPYVNWGDSDGVRVGDWVIAIGNPLGFDGTVTAGIVSAIQRGVPDRTGTTGYNRYIQTDASINRGNSGGPMFDMAGNVVGVNSALISPTGTNIGIGLAIPATQAQRVIAALQRGERPERGYLGVQLQVVDESIADAVGLDRESGELVRRVVDGQPAANAGIRQGDIILQINGREVTSDQSVSYLIANEDVGDNVPVVILRDGRRLSLDLTVGNRPSEEELQASSTMEPERMMPDESDRAGGQALGLALRPLDDRIRRALNLDEGTQGVLIAGIDPRSDAARKGLQARDVILSINRRRVSSPAEVTEIVDAARDAGRENVLLLVKRPGTDEGFVAISIDD